jgi:hypothetical protein
VDVPWVDMLNVHLARASRGAQPVQELLQDDGRASPAEALTPSVSGRTDHAPASAQETTEPAQTIQQQNGAAAAPPAERPKRAAKGAKRHGKDSRNRAANGDAVNRVRQGAEEAGSPAVDSTAADGTALHRTAAAAGQSGRGEAADASQQQVPQVAADVAWGRTDGSPAADARDLVLQRLLRPRSAAAHAMPIRPQLQVLIVHALLLAEGTANDGCCDGKLQQ